MIPYDKYYQTQDLFGAPYPELIDFFNNYPQRGKLLDLGCGQGRDAIPLARLGYEVTGIDNSKIGIQQLTEKVTAEKLKLTGIVANIFEYKDFSYFDFILLDSMFHFAKKDKQKETAFIHRMLNFAKRDTIIVFCIQDTGNKVSILNETIGSQQKFRQTNEISLQYEFKDDQTGHCSTTDYKMIVGQIIS